MIQVNNFIEICQMTQQEVKAFMKDYLTSQKYDVIDEDGFLYAKGDIPVLLVAHMDTVHKEKCADISISDGRISSKQGIGGDDRCGVFIISEIVKELHCSVLLCEDEESGGIGAKKFTDTDYINNLDVNYMIEFDRKGNNDAVFYSCDNKEFTRFVVDATGFEHAYGSFSDISVLMPAAKLSAVNLSSGYYNAHSVTEYVVWLDMTNTIEAARELIKTECNGPFEYVAKKYSSGNYRSCTFFDDLYRYQNGYQYNFDDYEAQLPGNNTARLAKDDKNIELEIIIPSEEMVEDVKYYSGNTKAECWMDFFMDNPDICFNDIITYSFS